MWISADVVRIIVIEELMPESRGEDRKRAQRQNEANGSGLAKAPDEKLPRRTLAGPVRLWRCTGLPHEILVIRLRFGS